MNDHSTGNHLPKGPLVFLWSLIMGVLFASYLPLSYDEWSLVFLWSVIIDICFCILSMSELWSMIIGVSVICDQCLFASPAPRLSRSHKSETLPVCTVCLFKIALHLICATVCWSPIRWLRDGMRLFWWLVVVCEFASWDLLQFLRAPS